MASPTHSQQGPPVLDRSMSGIESMPPTHSDTLPSLSPSPSPSPSRPPSPPDPALGPLADILGSYVLIPTRPNTPEPIASPTTNSSTLSLVPTEIVIHDPRTDQEIAVDECRNLGIKIRDYAYIYVPLSERVPTPWNPNPAFDWHPAYLEGHSVAPLDGESLFQLLRSGWLTQEDQAKWDTNLWANLKKYQETDSQERRAWFPSPRTNPAVNLVGIPNGGTKRQANFEPILPSVNSLDTDRVQKPSVLDAVVSPIAEGRPRKRQRAMSPVRSDDDQEPESFGLPLFLLREPRQGKCPGYTGGSACSPSSAISVPRLVGGVKRTASAMSV